MCARRLSLAPIGAAAVLLAQTVPAAPLGTPVQEAKRLVTRLQKIQSMRQIAPLLTNESASVMGIMMAGMLVMFTGMAEGMSGAVQGMAEGISEGLMGDGIAGEERPPAPPKVKPSADPKLGVLKAISADLQKVMLKYGFDPAAMQDAPPTQAERKRLMSGGRAFLGEVLALMDRLPDKKSTGGLELSSRAREMKPEQLRYRQISPTRVRIVDPKSPKQEIEARLEGGAWRLHLGGLDQALSGKAPTPSGPSQPRPR